MKIYIDVIFFENLIMNYIILYATATVLKRPTKHFRILASSLIGSIYALLMYFKISSVASNIIMKVILSVVMCFVAYGSEAKKIYKDVLMFYFISFVFGGCSFALIYIIDSSKVKINNGVLVGLYPIKVTIAAGAIAFIIIQICFKITKNKLTSRDMIGYLTVKYANKKNKIKTLIDTGNMLKEPISGYPVVIVEKYELEKVFPKELMDTADKMKRGEVEDNKYLSKIRIIPFSSLGKENGMLIGIKTDSVEIRYKDTEEIVNNVVIGIYEKKLTKENDYNALIGLNLLEESEINEYSKNIKRQCKYDICKISKR